MFAVSVESKTAQKQGATSAAADGEPANSPRRIESSTDIFLCREGGLPPAAASAQAGHMATPIKPFRDNVEALVGVEDREERSPVPTQDGAASSCLVTGSGDQWSPEMGIEKFRFSYCKEWRLTDHEFVGPKCTLSPAVAPGTFQKYTVPFPGST